MYKSNYFLFYFGIISRYYISLCIIGARMMYRYLPKSVGLRRITLHKSISQGDKMYLLICECSQLQDNLSAAAILLPALRARLCGYTGLYRPSVCFWFLTQLLESARSIVSNCITCISPQENSSETVFMTFQRFILYFIFIFYSWLKINIDIPIYFQ